MAKMRNTEVLMRRLKQQLALLRRKEKTTSNRLQQAFKTIKKLGRSYKQRAAANIRKMKAKIASAEAAAYRRAASEIEGKIQRKIIAKQQALGRAITRYEKTVAAKLSRFLEKKAERVAKFGGIRRGKSKTKSRSSN